MASQSAGFAVPQKILNFSSTKAKVSPSTGHTPAECPGIIFPGDSFDDENRIFRKCTSGSARTRWVSEDSEHRRPATRQRGICGSSLEQSVPNFLQARMTAENGLLEVVRNPSLPAPAQSAEPPGFGGFRAIFQFRRNPLVSVFRAHADVSRRDDNDGLLARIGKRIDFVATIHRQRAPAEKKKWHIGSKAGRDFHHTLERYAFLRQPHHAAQRCACVARSATQAARYRHPFFELCMNSEAELQFAPHRIDSAPHQIFWPSRRGGVTHLDGVFFFRQEGEAAVLG